jgi:hypothetical protein
MKFLHLTFHKGCELEIEYVLTKLGHEVAVMRFDDGETEPFGTPYVQSKIYEVTHDRAQKSWNKYKDYYETFDAIITSDTCPVSRTFLQNNWQKPLFIWICNRFDYAMMPEQHDPEFYELLRNIPYRRNVRIFGNAQIENLYSVQVKRVDVGDFIIKPIGKNMESQLKTKTYSPDDKNIFYIPPYHNETKLMNLSEKLTELGIENRCERFPNHISELLEYKGVVCIPYAWSTIVFFERMQLGLVTFIPTPRFLIELFRKGDWWFQPPFNIQHPEALSISEWYCPEHEDLFVFFDSWIDLLGKINTIDYEAKTKTVLDFAAKHEEECLNRWSKTISSITADNGLLEENTSDAP